ncbi:MAG: hypothetical protein GVY17_00850 [Cyanobacteria bacterium]|jgi:hypothetical protein|nr:hypothetical protein [Cyanobacteria bacterium GSL.Bin21]
MAPLPYIPCRGKYAQSQQRRLQRWLHNSRINIHRLYQPLITAALSTWQEPNLIKAVKEELRWHYRIRLKKDCWIWAGLRCGQLKDYHFGAGEALCLQNVRLYKDQPSELVNVIMGRNNVNGEFWAVVSDETTTLQTYAEWFTL